MMTHITVHRIGYEMISAIAIVPIPSARVLNRILPQPDLHRSANPHLYDKRQIGPPNGHGERSVAFFDKFG